MSTGFASRQSRALRSFALRHLTGARLTPTASRSFAIPQWQHFAIAGGIVGGIKRPRISDTTVCSWPVAVRSHAIEFSCPAITRNLASWQVVIHEKEFAEFAVKVYGKRFRLAVQEAERKTRQPSLFTDAPAKPPSDPKFVTQISPLYAHLYELLYPPPDDFTSEQLLAKGELRPYQKTGIEFLVHREHALLADDMGLGKTLQCVVAIAILRRSERVGRVLIICPRAVILQWQAEALRWGDIRAKMVDGSGGQRALIWAFHSGVLLATPHIVERDREVLEKQHFDLVVCDDVSMLKNPNAKITKAIRSIPRERSWCLNGTPLEGKPEDFVNVMAFVHEKLFSSSERTYAPSINVMHKRIAPHFLRRTKRECLKDLPPKCIHAPVLLEMSPEQWETYHAIEKGEWAQTQTLGYNAGKVHYFAIITRLIQACNYDKDTKRSAKADALAQQLKRDLLPDNPDIKAIVFSRFVKTLEFLADYLADFKPIIYSGSLNDRQRDDALLRFRKEGRLLLMSTKAGARGLNLQEANHVFHFDRTWNPVDALQGEDRCWRFGQKREVQVRRYIQTGTIEERIEFILRKKLGLIDDYVESLADDPDEDSDRVIQERWSVEELIEVLRPSSV